MAGPRDPDNPGRRAPTPTPKRTPSTSQGARPLTGPNSAARDIVSETGFTRDEYNNWYNYMVANDPYFVASEQAWGSEFTRWAFQNEYTQRDENAIQADLIKRGWTDPWSVIGKARPGSGGRGYGGGGGGASIAEQEASAAAGIKNQAETLGVHLDDGELAYVAKVAVGSKWSNEQLNDWLIGRATTDQAAGKLGLGTVSRGVDEIKQMAANQLITISDDTARGYSLKIQSGEMDPAVLQSLFQQQATARYAWAESALSKGITMKDYLLPSRDAIANELEKPADSIDMMDSKWLDMMQTIDSKGATRAATQSEITSRVRKLDEFKSTNRAKDLTSQAAMYLRQYMGA